eukprot:scaffold334_cov241-Pinguiococcus_pyrenoidosus.AAC.11
MSSRLNRFRSLCVPSHDDLSFTLGASHRRPNARDALLVAARGLGPPAGVVGGQPAAPPCGAAQYGQSRDAPVVVFGERRQHRGPHAGQDRAGPAELHRPAQHPPGRGGAAAALREGQEAGAQG